MSSPLDFAHGGLRLVRFGHEVFLERPTLSGSDPVGDLGPILECQYTVPSLKQINEGLEDLFFFPFFKPETKPLIPLDEAHGPDLDLDGLRLHLTPRGLVLGLNR
ncbi:MAG: hypothetical protein K0S38_905, partial [Candidatus Paceibacter sp.]|nr:hypothetical protein [Candidatus Paceibacter sp.]